MLSVLATGGLGFIGSHTFTSLLENGFDVLVVDFLLNRNLNTFNESLENSYKETNEDEDYLDKHNEFTPCFLTTNIGIK